MKLPGFCSCCGGIGGSSFGICKLANKSLRFMCEENNPGIRPTLFPKVIYISKDPPLAIVLKDIEVDNFYDARLPPQSLEDSKKIFSRVAKFHAASYFLTEQLYIDLSYYNYSVYQAEQYVKNILKSSLKLFKKSMLSWKDLDQRYVTKIDYLTENISRIGTKIYSAAKPDQGFNVLNHGDCHLGNIMMNSVDGKIEDLCLIDFQLSVFATPAVDLISCFSVLTEENRDKYFDEIVAFYHTEFVYMLRKMGFLKPPPSLLDFHIELMRHGILQIIINICFIPHILIGKTLTEDDWKTNPNDENFKMKIYQSEDFQRIIKKELDRMIRKGFI